MQPFRIPKRPLDLLRPFMQRLPRLHDRDQCQTIGISSYFFRRQASHIQQGMGLLELRQRPFGEA